MSNWSPELVPGPEWRSFEQLRLAGSTALESISVGQVATLQIKTKTFRILCDYDFQRLVGLASEVHRLRRGITIVLHAARIVAKHPNDIDGIELLCQTASMLGESNLLPVRPGHDRFEISPEEVEQYADDDLMIPESGMLRGDGYRLDHNQRHLGRWG
jgi:hypothetical protein